MLKARYIGNIIALYSYIYVLTKGKMQVLDKR